MSSPIGKYAVQPQTDGPDISGDNRSRQMQGSIEPGGTCDTQGTTETVPMENQAADSSKIDAPVAPESDPTTESDEQSPDAETDFESYETFYGMRESPFTLTPNPAFFFVNERSREGLKQIEYGIRRREGFAVISGDVGTGKTTLCWALLEKLEKMNVSTALVQNPMVSATDVLKLILHDLGVRPKEDLEGEQKGASYLFDTSWMAGMGQMELIERLNTFLVEMARKGLFTVVIIDEAQRLSTETMEQLRLLSNLETANQKLLQIIFVGQAELEQMLATPQLKQLNQRISVRFATKPLGRKDTGDYVRHRLRIAWAIPRLQFKKSAFDTIYRLSGGYPRLINMICDRALSYAFQHESYVVTPRMVRRGFRSIKELAPSCKSVWIRRLILLAGVLALVLTVVLFLLSRNLIPRMRSLSSPTPASTVSAAGPTLETGSSRGDKPSAAVAIPARTQSPPIEAPPRPAAATRQSSTTGRQEYILQISAFREPDSARAASEELKSRGVPSFLEHHGSSPGGDWYRVYAGPYSELSAAAQTASALEATLRQKPLLRRRTVQ